MFLDRLPGARFWLDRRRLAERTTALLAEVGCALDPWRPVGELSVAEQQLVEIAKALAGEVLGLCDRVTVLRDGAGFAVDELIRLMVGREVGQASRRTAATSAARRCSRSRTWRATRGSTASASSFAPAKS